jgi:hypothetical protein
MNATELTWPNDGGITINYPGKYNSVYFSDFSLTTGVPNGGNAISHNQLAISIPVAWLSPQNTIARVTVRGTDIYNGVYNTANYWTRGVSDSGVSWVSFDTYNYYGETAPAHTNAGYVGRGQGVYLVGRLGTPAVVFNFANCNFSFAENGIEVDSYVDGVTVNQSNFDGGHTGIGVPPGESGLTQLVVTNSQFNVDLVAVNILSSVGAVKVTNNLMFLPFRSSEGIVLQNSWDSTVVYNSILGIGTARGIGIEVKNTAMSTLISGNMLVNLTIGIQLDTAASGVLLMANHYGTTMPISDAGTDNTHDVVIAAISSGFGLTPSISGDAFAGRVTVGSGGASSGVIAFTPAFTTPAPSCSAQDETTPNTLRATATASQLTITGTMIAADKVTYTCKSFR